MHAIILAAGRGSRLGDVTDLRPKGMVELEAKPILEWQRKALIAGGADSVSVITGYRGEIISEYGFHTIYNKDWSLGNMLSSLDLALKSFAGPLIISYADILYNHFIVCDLISSTAPLTVAYDKDWLSLWRRRFDDPLSDAETFRVTNDNVITEIGSKASSLDCIQGQFMGLIKLGTEGRKWVEELFVTLPEARLEMDTTKLLSTLIDNGKQVKGMPITGGWCEIDSQSDLEIAKELLAENNITLLRCG